MGVEEELLLVDPETGALLALSTEAVAAHVARVGSPGPAEAFGPRAGMDHEIFLAQIEVRTVPCTTSAELLSQVVDCRREAALSAASVGAQLVASGAPVLAGGAGPLTPGSRYQRIEDEFQEVSRQAAVCGMHVHVEIGGDDQGVTVIDGLRPWLPVLRAMSVNSPYWQGIDTGYASWRSQTWDRFPSSGVSEPFGDAAVYHESARALVESGAALDLGMIYAYARLSRRYPTVEVRVFDVTSEPSDTVLLAQLTRALVSTFAETPAATLEAMPPWRTEALRAAHWRASRYGLSSDLLDPYSGTRRDARSVVESLLEFVGWTLRAAGESEEVRSRVEDLFDRGTGAARQQAAFESGGLEAVIRHLCDRFAASCA